MYGPFHVFRFPAAELPDVAYVETMTSAVYLDKKTDVDAYLDAHDRLSAHAAPADTTTSLLHHARKET